jgi:hypothetical protein
MKRLALTLAAAALLAMPASVAAFHHGGLPSTQCAAEAAGSPSNDNGNSKESITAHNPFGLPLPPARPIGNSDLDQIPGNGQGDGGEHCANG